MPYTLVPRLVRGPKPVLRRGQGRDEHDVGQGVVTMVEIVRGDLGRLQASRGLRQAVVELQQGGVARPVPVVGIGFLVRFHLQAEVEGVGKRGHGARSRRVDEGNVAAALDGRGAPPVCPVGVEAGHFGARDEGHAAQTMGAALSHGGHVAPGNAGIGDSRAGYFRFRLDDVADLHDTRRVAGAGHVDVGPGDIRIFHDQGQKLVLVDAQDAVFPARLRSEHDVTDRKGSDFKFHRAASSSTVSSGSNSVGADTGVVSAFRAVVTMRTLSSWSLSSDKAGSPHTWGTRTAANHTAGAY